MRKIIYKEGEKIGKCSFVKEIEAKNKYYRLAIFICPLCGKEFVSAISYVKVGDTTSCGCRLKEIRENIATLNLSHGMSGNYIAGFNIWSKIKDRCLNKKNKSYPDYGGRGIKICERWVNSFQNFFDDMGMRPSLNHSIERRDNDKDYEPNNCYWATPTEQNRNKRNTVRVYYSGIEKCISEWCEILGLNYSAIRKKKMRSKLPYQEVFNLYVPNKLIA